MIRGELLVLGGNETKPIRPKTGAVDEVVPVRFQLVCVGLSGMGRPAALIRITVFGADDWCRAGGLVLEDRCDERGFADLLELIIRWNLWGAHDRYP